MKAYLSFEILEGTFDEMKISNFITAKRTKKIKYFVKPVSELVPLTNSNMSGDKCEGLSTTSRGDVEELRTWLQRMCCALAIPASSYFGGLRDREMEVRQRSELPEGRGDRGEQRGVHRKYSR